MRTIERSTAFKRDYKRVKSTPKYHKHIDLLLEKILVLLLHDKQLPDHHRDHALNGNFYGYRECHVKPDLLLLYKKTDNHVLRLARLGSHSELFG